MANLLDLTRLMECETDPDEPLSLRERICLGAAMLLMPLAVVGLLSIFCGCKAFYEHSGSSLSVGEVTAPVEFSEPSDSLTVRVLFNMTGARVWTAKDALVKVQYRNAYTNSYLYGMADKTGAQDFDVSVEPLAVDAPSTNALEATELTR